MDGMSMIGLNKITDRILADAQEQADRITAEAEAECARIRADYEARAEEIREKISVEAEKDALDLIERAKASAETQKRNILLQKKSELVDQVFDTTLDSMRALEGEKYTSLLIGLLTACFTEQLDSERASADLYGEEEMPAPDAYEVMMNPRDRDRYGRAVIEGVCKKLAGKVEEKKLECLVLSGTTVSIDGGFILRCGSIEANCSFALLFAQLREELEAEVGHALFTPKKQN